MAGAVIINAFSYLSFWFEWDVNCLVVWFGVVRRLLYTILRINQKFFFRSVLTSLGLVSVTIIDPLHPKSLPLVINQRKSSLGYYEDVEGAKETNTSFHKRSQKFGIDPNF